MLTDEQRAEIAEVLRELVAHYARASMRNDSTILDSILATLAVQEEVRRAATDQSAITAQSASDWGSTWEMIAKAAGCSRQNAQRKWSKKWPAATPVADDEPAGERVAA